MAIVDNVDQAPIGQLGNRQARYGVDDAPVIHRLGECAQLRQELKARLGPSAFVASMAVYCQRRLSHREEPVANDAHLTRRDRQPPLLDQRVDRFLEQTDGRQQSCDVEFVRRLYWLSNPFAWNAA